MVSRQDDMLNAHVKKYSNPTSQVVQNSVHLPACLGDVVLLAELINLLRSHKNQLCIFDALTNLLCGLGQKIVQLGIKNIHACMLFQKRYSVLAIFNDGPIDLQRQFAAACRHDLRNIVCAWQQRRHADLRYSRHSSEGRLEVHLKVFSEQASKFPAHFKPKRIHPHIGGLLDAQKRLDVLFKDLALAGNTLVRGILL